MTVVFLNYAGGRYKMHSGIPGWLKSTQITSRCILDKRGGSRTHPGIWTVLAMWTLNWNRSWAATDDVVQTKTHIEKRLMTANEW